MKHKAFVAEASLAGKLNHPHIVDILDAVVEPDHSYLVMEYVAGTTLEAHSEVNNLLPLNKVVEIIFKCIRALEYAFQHGIIHRDIKPGNILLSARGETKVSDFGASFRSRGHDTTQITGIGSPAYMSPEQVRLEPLTHQTDIYSALAYAILNTPAPPPRTLRPDLPPLLDQVVMKTINKDPAKRYASWLEFGKDLSQAFTALRLVGESASDSEKFNELRNLPFFVDFGDVALWEVVRIATWKTLPKGTTVIREGDEGDSCFLLVKGELAVTLGDLQLATIKPGGCFGEMLNFTNLTRRTSSVTALSDVTVVEIKAKALRAATDGCQAGFNKAVIRVLIERLLRANRRVAGGRESG
jgi:hypothetical protein